MDLRQFGARLRELREKAGLSQLQLAERIGCTRVAVARWEGGAREPSATYVKKLSDAFGVECGALYEEPAGEPVTRLGRPPKPRTEEKPKVRKKGRE